MRSVLGPIGRWFLRPTSVGAIYVVALTLHAASRGAKADEALGGQTRSISEIVQTRFGSEVTRMTLAIIATAMVVGAVCGFIAGALVRIRDRLARARERSVVSLALGSLVAIVALHGLIEAWAMAQSPQLYADVWYARGGVGRAVQVVVTDVLGTRGVLWLGALVGVGFLAGPRSQWRRWPGRLRRALLPRSRSGAKRVVLGCAVLAAGSLASALWRAPLPSAHAAERATREGSSRPNVLILAADSLRADRLDPRIAPHLVSLAEHAARFDRAYVSLPRTFPSWVTLLTGRHPHHHGIRSMFPRWEDREKDFDALPERLAHAGYKTAVVSDYAGDIFDRIDLGFREVIAPTFDFRQLIRQRALERQTPLLPFLHSRPGRTVFPVLREMNDAADPNMLAFDAIRAIHSARDAPFFVTVFFSTAHFPYAAPAPYYGRFTRAAYRGRFKYHKPVGLESEAPPDDDDIAQIRGLYDGAVASIDDAIGQILGALREFGIADHTIVVVTADHGETLYENGHGAGHGDHLFGDEGTHVPLIVFDPRRSVGRRVPGIVRDVDLAPTVYSLTGVEGPADLDGASLVPAIDGAPLTPRFAYAETGLWFTESIEGLPASMRLPYPGIARMTEVDAVHGEEVVLRREVRAITLVAKHRMVRDDRYKLVYVPTRRGVEYLLFDTERDPGEVHDVARTLPEQVVRLKGELWKWLLLDAQMVEHGGYIVPRESAASSPASEQGPAIRVDRVEGAR